MGVSVVLELVEKDVVICAESECQKKSGYSITPPAHILKKLMVFQNLAKLLALRLTPTTHLNITNFHQEGLHAGSKHRY